MNYLEQAEAYKRIIDGMKYYLGNHNYGEKFTEQEVGFRYETLKNMLIILQSDAYELVKSFEADYEWEKEHGGTKKGV